MPLDLRGACPYFEVFDMPTSLAFYCDVLGFAIHASAPASPDGDRAAMDWVWLKHDVTELMLNTAYDPDAARPAVPDATRVQWHGDSMLFIGAPDVDGVYAHLRAAGVGCDAPKNAPYGMRQLFIKDPDGYGLCFQWSV
jgi:glyoxylase I family protein